MSDMSAPWEQTTGFSVKTLSNPYHRLMNTSGNGFRDHVGSMVGALESYHRRYVLTLQRRTFALLLSNLLATLFDLGDISSANSTRDLRIRSSRKS